MEDVLVIWHALTEDIICHTLVGDIPMIPQSTEGRYTDDMQYTSGRHTHIYHSVVEDVDNMPHNARRCRNNMPYTG